MGDFLSLAKHYWKNTLVDTLYQKNVILNWLNEGKKLDVSGQDMKEARYNDDQQAGTYAYGDDTIVTGTTANDKATATFQWKAVRHDIIVTEREMLLTKGMMEVGIDYVADRMDRAMVSVKRYFNNRLLGLSGTTTDGSLDFQGLTDALTHDLTYGGVTRATTVTNSDFQGGSIAGTFADQATVYPATVATVRDMADTCNAHSDVDNGELTLFVGRLPFRELQGQVEGQVVYDPAKKLKYGCPYFTIDDIDVVLVKELTEAKATGASRWAFMLNRPTWNFRLHPERNFTQTEFMMQDKQLGGKAVAMSTIKVFGNCWCSDPQSNIWVPKFGS